MLRLASPKDHASTMTLVNEEYGMVPINIGGDVTPRVHADRFGETPAGGGLFATSSIAWCGSLSLNRYNSNVSRLTWNVPQRVMDEALFPVRSPSS